MAKTASGIGGRLTRKVGPLPVWGWAFLIVGGYLAYRKLSGGGAPAGQDTTAFTGTLGTNDNTGASSGGMGAGGGLIGGGGTSDGGTQALLDLLGQTNAALADLPGQIGDIYSQPPPWYTPYDNGSGGSSSGDVYDPGDTNSPPAAGAAPTSTKGAQYNTKAKRWASTSTKASNNNFGATAQAKSTVLKSTGKAAPFGGVVSVKKLKNGSTLTTYASGRQVQQAPGKSAYVVKK